MLCHHGQITELEKCAASLLCREGRKEECYFCGCSDTDFYLSKKCVKMLILFNLYKIQEC